MAKVLRMKLEAVDQTQWRQLRKAADDPAHPFRNVTLATLSPDGHPQARYLILRGADADARTLELHTDIRSTKWTELAANPQISVLAYDPEARVQIRLTGTATRHGPGTPAHDAAWASLSTWARKTYCGGPPGLVTDWVEVDQVTGVPPTESEVEMGHDSFGVLTLSMTSLDWFKHPRGEIRRAQFSYAADGSLMKADWIEP